MKWSPMYLITYWQHKLYSSIDTLPIWNWMEIHASGDLTLLVVEKKRFHPDYMAQWRALYDQFNTRFGMSDEYKRYLEDLKKAVVLMGEVAVTGDAVKRIDLHVVEQRLEAFKKKPTVDFYNNNAALEKFMGFAIDPKRVSVAEYYGKVKLMEKAAKDAQRQALKGHGKSN